MSADRQLAKEIEFDLQKFEKEQQDLEKQKNRPTPTRVRNFIFHKLADLYKINKTSFYYPKDLKPPIF